MTRIAQLLILGFALALNLTFTACKKKKNNTVSITGELPLKTIMASKSGPDTLYSAGGGAANFGLKFYTKTGGNIIKLGCRMPSAGTYEVSIWDFDSADLLAMTKVAISGSNDFNYSAISPLKLKANTKYVVSVNSGGVGGANAYYQMFKKPTPSGTIYPITSGNVIIEAPLYKAGASSAFPNYNNASDFPYLRGIADFEFVID